MVRDVQSETNVTRQNTSFQCAKTARELCYSWPSPQ